MTRPEHRLQRWSRLALAATLACGSLAAHAAAFTLTAFANVDGSSPPGSSVMDGNATGGDFLATIPGTTGSLFFHTYGYATPLSYFGARVSGEGTFFGRTTAGYTDAYTNTGSVAQLVTFSFNVDQGGVDVAGTGTGYAELDLILKFNGSTVARDRTRVEVNGSGATCNDYSGSDDIGVLAGYQTCASPTGSSADGNGGLYVLTYLLNAGETLNIDYEIRSEVQGNFTGSNTGGTFCSGFGELAEGPVPQRLALVEEPGGHEGQPGYSDCRFFHALARSGDPAGLNGPTFGPANFALNVPEPGSLALALGGLAAATRLRRRRT